MGLLRRWFGSDETAVEAAGPYVNDRPTITVELAKVSVDEPAMLG